MDEQTLALVHDAAAAAIVHARDVRATYRKRTPKGTISREQDIALALTRLRRVMAPIRSEIARNKVSADVMTELKDASTAIQRERRKLWKMQKRKRGRYGKRRTGR